MRNFYKILFTLAVILLVADKMSAQSYFPGGLGTTGLQIWLNANKGSSITQNGSSQVSQWSDLSGNNYHFGQSTAGNKPLYSATAGPNSKPALTFTSTSAQYLSTLSNLPASITFTSGVSAFAVASFNAPQTSQGWQRIYDFGNGTGSDNFMMGRYGSSANFYYEGWKGSSGDQTYTTTSPIVNGTATLYEAVQQGGTAGTLSSVAHFLAGTSQSNTGGAGSSKTWVPAAIARTSNYIGRSNWAADNYFSGTVSEILIYTTAFNTSQRIILENYFSAEWGNTISTSQYTPPASFSYSTSLVGVGYTSSTDYFLSNPAGSTDGMGFSSGSGSSDFLGSAGYMMAAHNGQANTVISNASIPGVTSASALTMWNRSWDLQKTGGNSSGLISLNFNFSDYNGSTANSTYVYALLYNATDGTFASGTNKLISTTSTNVSGSIVSFGVNAANLTNGYYTILYSVNPIVLPVTLSSFTAEAQSGTTLLKWVTATETGIDHFAIERSADGTNFTGIGTVAANGSFSLPSNYSFTDGRPFAGMNYYRLGMIDRNGGMSYSGIRVVDHALSPDPTITIYPNPLGDILYVSIAESGGKAELFIVNSIGQVVRAVKAVQAGITEIYVHDLAAGTYFIRMDVGATKYVRVIMKK